MYQIDHKGNLNNIGPLIRGTEVNEVKYMTNTIVQSNLKDDFFYFTMNYMKPQINNCPKKVLVETLCKRKKGYKTE